MVPGGTSVEIEITFPAQSPTSSIRRPAYVSASIESLAITIDGGTPTFVNAPAPTGSPQTVTTTIPVSPGSHSFALSEYDKASGAGNLLGAVTESATIVEGTNNVLHFTLNGNLAKIVIQPPTSAFLEGTLANGFTLVGCQPQTFNAVPEDADGNTIVMPGLVPQITAVSSSSGIVPTAEMGDRIELEAPAPLTTAATITASGENLAGATVSTAFKVAALGAFYVADFEAQKVRVFDENGLPLTLPATAFPHITNPMGLATSPCSATASGDLYLTETSNPVYPYVAEFDLNGVPVPLAAGAFSFDPGNFGNAQPLLLADAAGTLVVPDEFSDQISEFSLAGSSLTLGSGTFAKLAQPTAIAYDPHNKQLYITDEGTATLNAYTAAGTFVASVSTNSHPFGVAFDSTSNSLYVASGGTTGAVLDTATPSPANVAEFSEASAAVSNTGGFLATSATAYYTGIAFDPHLDELFVGDAGDSKIVAYTPAGAAVTLGSGAFSTISASATPAGDPIGLLFVP